MISKENDSKNVSSVVGRKPMKFSSASTQAEYFSC
jgi:hypothetical protein